MMGSDTQRQLDGCTADAISAVLEWSRRSGSSDHDMAEAERVIGRLIRCKGHYWELSVRDDVLIEVAFTFYKTRSSTLTYEDLENMRRRTYRGALVTDSEATLEQLETHFSALGTWTRQRGRPGDIARLERVAHEVASLKREGVALWRQTKPAAGRYKNPNTPAITLTDEARKRLESAYAPSRENAAIFGEDFLSCVQRAEKVAG